MVHPFPISLHDAEVMRDEMMEERKELSVSHISIVQTGEIEKRSEADLWRLVNASRQKR